MDKINKHAGKANKHPEAKEKNKLPELAKYIGIAAAVIAVIALAIIIYYSSANSYVAIINGEKITTGEYKCYLEMQSQTMYYNAYSLDNSMTWNKFWSTDINGENPKEYAKKIALKNAKETKLQYAKAKEAGIKLDQAERKYIEDYITTNIVDKLGDGLKLKANKEFKKQYGFTVDDFRKVQIETYTVSKYWASEISDEDTDVENWYNKKPEWFKENVGYRTDSEEAVWVRYIMVAPAGNAETQEGTATQEDMAKAEDKAKELIAKLKAGTDFSELEESSDDGNVNVAKGELILGKGDFIAALDEAAFSLDEGEVTEEPIKTNNGYYILKLEEKIPEDQPVSLRCAKEYGDLGTDFVKYRIIDEKVEEWMNNAQVKDNTDVYSSITIPEKP